MARRRTATRCLVQSPGVEPREVDGELFLIVPAADAIHHLDPLAASVWRLFATPTEPAQVRAILRAAFPEVPESRIAADLEGLVADLRANGLIEPVATRRARRPKAGGGAAPL